MSQCTCPSGDGSLRWPCPVHSTTHRLDNVLQHGKPAYGCHNVPRPLSGKPVFHGGYGHGKVIAFTRWNGLDNHPAPEDWPVPCIYQRDHQHDELCDGCEHKGKP